MSTEKMENNWLWGKFCVVPSRALRAYVAGDLQAFDLTVLMALTSHFRSFAHIDTAVHPGQKRLADLLGSSKPTVSRSLKRLEETGFVRRQIRHRKAGRGRDSTEYVVLFDDPNAVYEPVLVSSVKLNDDDAAGAVVEKSGEGCVEPCGKPDDQVSQTPVQVSQTPVQVSSMGETKIEIKNKKTRTSAHTREGGGSVENSTLLSRLRELGNVEAGPVEVTKWLTGGVRFDGPERLICASGLQADRVGRLFARSLETMRDELGLERLARVVQGEVTP